uniref:Col_cuticle_N domain-containing protein n=1 Tax=Bursaphelenchus xylophilus TaxID=6326 RepID=A0A1I7S182_BURXY
MVEVESLTLISTSCSVLSLILCILIMPELYSNIDLLRDEVADGVNQYRLETDAAWIELLGMQLNLGPLTRRRENPFASVFRRKRQAEGLPAWCQCELSKPHCAPGPAGPPGPTGPKGRPGEPGTPGEDFLSTTTVEICDPPEKSCIQCPHGAPGPVGEDGIAGPKGPEAVASVVILLSVVSGFSVVATINFFVVSALPLEVVVASMFWVLLLNMVQNS